LLVRSAVRAGFDDSPIRQCQYVDPVAWLALLVVFATNAVPNFVVAIIVGTGFDCFRRFLRGSPKQTPRNAHFEQGIPQCRG